MSKRTGRKPKRERTSRRRTRRHSSTSGSSSEDVPPPAKTTRTRASSRVTEADKKVALTIKLPKTEGNEDDSSGMWKVECSNGSDGDIQKLKISLRRSPKDLLREQAAEEKRKEKEAAGSSNSSVLDGSVTNYLEQFGSSAVVEETVEEADDTNDSVQVVIPANEPICNENDISQVDNDQIDDSGGVVPEIVAQNEDTLVKNTSIENKLIDEVVSETLIETNETHEIAKDPVTIAVESINPPNSFLDISDKLVHPSVEECTNSELLFKEKSVNDSEVLHSVVDIPLALNEKIQVIEPELVESCLVNESKTSEIIEENNVLTVETVIPTNNSEESNKTDIMNDSEQMEDVVQLAVESPDLVDDDDNKLVDEDESKSVDEDEPKSIDEDEPKSFDGDEPKSVKGNESKSVDEDESKSNDEEESIKQVNDKKSNSVYEEKATPIEVSYPILSSNQSNSQQDNAEKQYKSDGTRTTPDRVNLQSSHSKRKWGICKTRTPIMISPFTLGKIIESNGDSIGDNGEYRSEEGEIQRTDSEEEQDVDEPMDTNDTMLIDHEAVDYEALDEEEKPVDDNEDSKSEKSVEEEIVDIEPKKKSLKRLATSSVIRITNLVRPFTVGQLRDLLQRTGKIVSNGFWIDTIKSQCIVEYENEDQAVETVYALNESQWPSTNPKFLKVVFTDKEELHKALNGTHPDRSTKQKESKVDKLRTHVDNHNIILREWDRGKLEDMNGEKEDKPIKRKLSEDPHVNKDKKVKKDEKDLQDKRKKSKSKTPERIPTKSLDELFRKTKITPTLYWSPLSAEQIAEKEDQRRKHLAEMERSQKTDRRRRDNVIYPRRR